MKVNFVIAMRMEEAKKELEEDGEEERNERGVENLQKRILGNVTAVRTKAVENMENQKNRNPGKEIKMIIIMREEQWLMKFATASVVKEAKITKEEDTIDYLMTCAIAKWRWWRRRRRRGRRSRRRRRSRVRRTGRCPRSKRTLASLGRVAGHLRTDKWWRKGVREIEKRKKEQ